MKQMPRFANGARIREREVASEETHGGCEAGTWKVRVSKGEMDYPPSWGIVNLSLSLSLFLLTRSSVALSAEAWIGKREAHYDEDPVEGAAGPMFCRERKGLVPSSRSACATSL